MFFLKSWIQSQFSIRTKSPRLLRTRRLSRRTKWCILKFEGSRLSQSQFFAPEIWCTSAEIAIHVFCSGRNRRCVVKSSCNSVTMCSTCGVFQIRIPSTCCESIHSQILTILPPILTILPPILAILPPILTIALGLGFSPGRVPNFPGGPEMKNHSWIEVFCEYLREFYEYLRVVNPSRMFARTRTRILVSFFSPSGF